MTFTTACPSCGEILEVAEEHRDWTVRCPQCRHEFVPTDQPGLAGRPRPRPRPQSRPRPRRRYRDDEPDIELARSQVSGPGAFLEVVGWGSLLLSLLGGVGFLIAGVVAQDRPRKPPNDDAVVFFILAGCFGVFGVPYSAVMAYGARKMRTLSSYGWAMASAILGIVSFLLLGICGMVHIAAGIWALVVLLDQNVKDSFDLRPRPDDEPADE